MNKKFVWIIVIVLIVLAIFMKSFSGDKEKTEFKPIDKNVGDEFTELSYPNTMYIVNYAVADVTGDSVEDMILLIGEKIDESNNYQNMDVVVYDTANATFTKADARKFNGGSNKIVIKDFTGEQILDIMIVNETDKMNVRIFTYCDGKLSEMWKERNNKGLVFSGNFLDGFKVEVVNKKLNWNGSLDLSSQKQDYINDSLYDDSGKLLDENKKIGTTGFVSVETVQLNDREGLRTLQRIIGNNDMDILDEIEAVWKYQDGKWQMVEVKGLKVGNLLY